MDAERFDTLAKALTGTKSRRSALGAAVAGGVLSALGLNQGPAVRAAQDDRCEIPGAGGTCVLDFEAIVREGPSASQPLVAGGSPGRLRGYLMFTRGRTGDLEDAKLFLDDGSSLPVSGLAIGQGFQARIDVGQGQALVAVGVGEPDVVRCLGRFDGTVTSTVTGDLGEWHALAGVQNIPGAAGSGDQATGSGNRPVGTANEAGLQLAQGSTTSGGRGNASNVETGNRPVAETSGGQPGSNASGGSGGSGARAGSNGTNDGSSPGNSGSDRPASDSGDGRPAGEPDEDRPSVEQRQESDDAEPVLACPEGQTRCSNACINTSSDVLNCGACDNVCALDEECNGGRCLAINDDADDDATVEECPAGQTRCGAICTDLQTDEANCGTCGTTCAAGEECVAGKCTPPAPVLCPVGQIRCDGICKEALPNFGSQGISCPGGGGVPTECPAGRVLCNGACFPEGGCQPTDCAPGWGYCYGVCRDFQNDPGYCGGCSTGCTGGAYCSGGKCFYCAEGFTPCGDKCVDTRTDLNNCGGCGNLCGTQCINGECTGVGPTPGCVPGTTRCGNTCVDLTRDAANCGTCGKVCGSDSTCYPPGECGFSVEYCETLGKQACGLGCGPKNDPFNCGGCGNVCPGGYACDADLEICYIIGDSKLNGVKPKPQQSLAPANQQTLVATEEVTCAPGLEDCDGVCTDLTTDMLNCGSCSNACVAGDTCQEGQCSPPSASSDDQTLAPGEDETQTELTDEPVAEPSSSSCPEGKVECAGICTDLSIDPLNCGNCGIVCGSGISCDFGVCGAPPAPVAPEDADQTAPEDEPVEPIDSAPESEPEPELVLEPESLPASEPEPVPAGTETEPAP